MLEAQTVISQSAIFILYFLQCAFCLFVLQCHLRRGAVIGTRPIKHLFRNVVIDIDVHLVLGSSQMASAVLSGHWKSCVHDDSKANSAKTSPAV